MSLVKTVLEGFNTGNIGLPNDDLGAGIDPIVTNAAIIEAMNTIITAERVVNNADVIASMKMVVEGVDVTPMMENVISDAITKIKNAFIKLKNAIKAWFAKAWKFIQSMLKSGAAFVKAYGDELKAKDPDGFEYLGYEWDYDGGALVCEKFISEVDKRMTPMIGDIVKAADMTSAELAAHIKDKKADSSDTSGYVEAVISSTSTGATDITTMKEEIRKAFHGGMSDPASDSTLTKAKVAQWLDVIETCKEGVKKMKVQETQFENRLNLIIRNLDQLGSKEDANGDKNKNASEISKCLTALLSIHKACVDCMFDCLKSGAKSTTAILKRFLHWGGKKATSESYDYDLKEVEMMEAMYPDLLSDTIMEEGLEVVQITDDYSMESSFNNNSGSSLFDQVSAMLGI